MARLISAALRSAAQDQAAAIADICRSNATAIARTVGELAHMHQRAAEVRGALAGANASMQDAGAALAAQASHAGALREVQGNLAAAAAAVRAALAVLEQCLAAGELLRAGEPQQQLYPALCMLDKIRRQHLGERARVTPVRGGAHACVCEGAGTQAVPPFAS
jgi:hypothetical protein